MVRDGRLCVEHWESPSGRRTYNSEAFQLLEPTMDPKRLDQIHQGVAGDATPSRPSRWLEVALDAPTHRHRPGHIDFAPDKSRGRLSLGMPFSISCDSCGASFAIPDDVFDRKVAGRVVSVRCKQCKKDIRVDGTKRGPSEAPPTAGGQQSGGTFTSAGAATPPAPDTATRPTTTATATATEAAGSAAAAQPLTAPRDSSSREKSSPRAAGGVRSTERQSIPRSAASTREPTGVGGAQQTRKKPAGKVAAPPKVWAVSYADDDDRELTEAQIASELAAGAITGSTIVWTEGMPDWKSIAEVRELAKHVHTPKGLPVPPSREPALPSRRMGSAAVTIGAKPPSTRRASAEAVTPSPPTPRPPTPRPVAPPRSEPQGSPAPLSRTAPEAQALDETSTGAADALPLTSMTGAAMSPVAAARTPSFPPPPGPPPAMPAGSGRMAAENPLVGSQQVPPLGAPDLSNSPGGGVATSPPQLDYDFSGGEAALLRKRPPALWIGIGIGIVALIAIVVLSTGGEDEQEVVAPTLVTTPASTAAKAAQPPTGTSRQEEPPETRGAARDRDSSDQSITTAPGSQPTGRTSPQRKDGQGDFADTFAKQLGK